MNSIAIWYEKEAADTNVVPELDVHINHWKLRASKASVSDHFMDIGLIVKNGMQVKSICIYIPGSIVDKGSVIEDIGGKLKNARILTAVFNESYSLTTGDNSKDFTVLNNDAPIFKVYTLDIEHDVQTMVKFKGTILQFPFHPSQRGLPTYYRLRLKSAFVNNLSFTYAPSNSLFESVNSSIEIIDFRINDTRDLDLSLTEYMRSVGKFNIAQVHYFVMRNVRDEYILSNQELKSVRQLEEQTWAHYITQSEYKYEKTFAYHLKQKVTNEERNKNEFLDGFSAVLKFRFEDSRIFWYVIGFIAVALAIELFANWLYDFLK